jgi:hypothetical protein
VPYARFVSMRKPVVPFVAPADPNRKTAGLLYRAVRRLPRQVELIPGIRRQRAGLNQLAPLFRIPQHTEEVHHVAVQIVVDLGIGPRLLQQHAGRAAERLDIAGVGREVLQHPGRDAELGAVVADGGALHLAHFSASGRTLKKFSLPR